MAELMNRLSLRTRLLLVTVGILAFGFLALALLTGQTIASAAREDFEQRLESQVAFIAQGIRADLAEGEVTRETLPPVLTVIAQRNDVTLTLLPTDGNGPPENQLPGFGGPFGRGRPEGRQDYPAEVETAMRGEIVVVERQNDDGEPTLFTAAAAQEGRGGPGVIIQLSVPLSQLQGLILRRWASIGAVFVVVLLASLAAAILLARSIIRPLDELRRSAARLAGGDLSARVPAERGDELGQVARAFNEMAAQVQSMLDEQRAFASNTSHELRTPLTNIRLRSEALRYDETLEPESHQQYIAEIDDEANRLGSLIEDLTLLSRFDAGRATLGENQVDMAHFAQNMKGRMAHTLTDHQLTLTLTAPTETPPMTVNLNHLTVVFRNLIDNAIKYGTPGGKIDWTVRADTSGVTSVLKDTGRGIAPEHLPHLFERFYRADKARSRDIPGSGLGLAIVQSVVEAYGGTIRVESAGLGQGSTVTVFWPYVPGGNPIVKPI